MMITHSSGLSTRPSSPALLCMALALSVVTASGELKLVPGETPYRLGLRETSVTAVPVRKLAAEPKYQNRNVKYLALRLGKGPNGFIIGAIDAETLYLDSNNNGNLADDDPMTFVLKSGAGATAVLIREVEVSVEYAEGRRHVLSVMLDIQRYGQDTWTVLYHVAQHLEGTIAIGERKDVLVGIYDGSYGEVGANGCFTDYGADRLRIDLNGDGEFDPGVEDSLLSKVISLDGRLWELELNAAGTGVETRPCTLPYGSVRFSFNTSGQIDTRGRIELVSEEGYAFTCPASDNEIVVPQATYRLASGQIAVMDDKARGWSAIFSYADPVTLGEDGVTIKGGAPLRIEPDIAEMLSTGDHVCFGVKLTGAGGETYENIAPAGSRMTPRASVEDTEGIVIAAGVMEYG